MSKKKKDWHCELCKFFGVDNLSTNWDDLSPEQSRQLYRDGWTRDTFNKLMKWLDHTPEFLAYAKGIVDDMITFADED